MIRLEKDFQTLFGHWLVQEKFVSMCELKISHGNTVTWGKFQDQQLPSLWKAYTEGIYIKLTDASIGLKPADCFFYKGPAYVVIMFNVPDNQKELYFVHIREIVKLKESGAKSISKKFCEEKGFMKSF